MRLFCLPRRQRADLCLSTAGQGRNAFPSPFSNHEAALGHSPPQFEPRSGAGVIDPATGLVQTSGLIPSSSNTYGALGIGISHTGAKGEGVPGDKKKKVRWCAA